jgi:hypothetical protein
MGKWKGAMCGYWKEGIRWHGRTEESHGVMMKTNTNYLNCLPRRVPGFAQLLMRSTMDLRKFQAVEQLNAKLLSRRYSKQY